MPWTISFFNSHNLFVLIRIPTIILTIIFQNIPFLTYAWQMFDIIYRR